MRIKNSFLSFLILSVFLMSPLAAPNRARNVILFLGDAGGIPVLNAAAACQGAPQSLFIQKMPHIGLSDTSSASSWVTDSAAGMTAIVTGEKTHNGVISQSDAAVRGRQDGRILKTILEYAEERGLSTGVITNDKVNGATPAACYAHSNDRKKLGEIFAQLRKPPFGDGLDLLIGPGKTAIAEADAAAGGGVEADLRRMGYAVLGSAADLTPETRRALVLLENGDFDLARAVEVSRKILSRNPKGYLLVVECDLHTDELKKGLDRTLLLDSIVEQTARSAGRDTLVLFTADHSFDTRLKAGAKGSPLLPGEAPATGTAATAARPAIRVDDGHTGEEVLVAAQGPGAENVRGFFPNTQIFRILMTALGWEPSRAARAEGK